VSTYTPTAHEPGCACTRCAAGQRNRFFKGKLMKAPEFTMEQRYGIERRRLINRKVAGWGVLEGFALKGARKDATPYPPPEKFHIFPGVAVDPHGRELLLAEEAVLTGENTFLLDDNCELKSLERIEPGEYVLAIHYAEHFFGDASAPGDCCDSKTEKNYVCETVVFSLRRVCEECPCGEPPCPRCCGCHTTEDSCGELGRDACLCHWTAKATGPDKPTRPCRWDDYEVYVSDGVDLACLAICERATHCHPPKGLIIDDCSPRRIVKRNDLLYDLIRGCDLTRIKCVSWGRWHRRARRVEWDEFIRRLEGCECEHEGHRVHQTGLEVTFTHPVRNGTIRPDCFTLSFAIGEAWREIVAVEVVAVKHEDWRSGDPEHTSRRAVICVQPEWLEEIKCHSSRFRKHGGEVRIEVRGDYILDCRGQAVDAEAHGFALHGEDCEKVRSSGNGSPGGTLVSIFQVEKAYAEPR